MKNNEYFRTLLNLYEAVSDEDAMHQQQKIADSGSDVEDPNVLPQAANAQEVAKENNAEQDNTPDESNENPEGLDDAAYLTSTSNVASEAQSDNSKKLKKLFDLMQNLSLYANSFKDTLDTVELGLLDDSILEEVQKYKDGLVELTNKIHDYLIDVFGSETYEKALYVYIMFRTELLILIKQLRKLLGLNEVDDKGMN